MANLDEKFLDGPSVGYCSSSEDEDGNEQKEEGNGHQQYSQPKTTTERTPKTGPKGVLADYEKEQRRKCAENREEEKRVQ
jgi:hypothetical protein